jgi:hypothetical protein
MANVPFNRYGAYAVHVLVAGEQKARLAFNVVEPPTSQPT